MKITFEMEYKDEIERESRYAEFEHAINGVKKIYDVTNVVIEERFEDEIERVTITVYTY